MPPIQTDSEIDQRVAELARRVDDLDARARSHPAPLPAAQWPSIVDAMGSAITPIVVFVLGLWLNDSVNTAFKRQELQISSASGMQELVKTLFVDTTSVPDAERVALAMAAFGPPAVGPLVSALSADEIRRPAAERGLRAVGLGQPEAVCAPMRKLIDNRTGRISWLVHLSALRLLGDLECRDSATSAFRYAQALAGVTGPGTLPAFARHLSDDPPVDLAAVAELKTEADRTLRILRGQAP